MRIALINQFYPPDGAPTGMLLQDLALALRARNHQVTVITSAGSYRSESAGNIDYQQDGEGIKILCVGSVRSPGRSLFGKLCSYVSFFRCARRQVNRLAGATDLFLFMTTPPLIGWLGYRLKRRFNKPYALWIMDLYPHALVSAGLIKMNGFLWKMINRFFKRERFGASAIFTIGPDMTDSLRCDDSPHLFEVPVWSRLRSNPEFEQKAQALRRSRGWDEDELVFMYSGNMGRAHSMDAFIALAKLVRSTGTKARFVASGEGPHKDAWQSACGTVIDFMPSAPGGELAAHLLSADIHLVSQSPRWKGVVVPSKFQSACSLGRPVIFAGPADSAVGRWILEHQAGWVINPEDPLTISKVAREIADPEARRIRGANARELSQQLFDAGKNTGVIISRLESIVGAPA